MNYEYEISNLYIEYFHKIIELAAKENFEFKVVSPFLRKDKKKLKYDKIQIQIKEEGLDEIFYGYFKNMKYLPLDYFSSHSNHYIKYCQALNLKNI